MKFMNIASGSSGNSTFIGSDKASILLDCGISMKRIENALDSHDMALKQIDGIVITHEHSDHIKGLGVISRKYSIPIYATKGTIAGIHCAANIGDIDNSLFIEIENDADFYISDINVKAHSVSHDANDPVCFSFTQDNVKVSVATDLGTYDEDLIEFLSDSDTLLIEANHDIRMLETGPYPYYLKRRIAGNRGHLSNEASGKLLRRLLCERLRHIYLGHLSDKNNYWLLCYETVKSELMEDEAGKAAVELLKVAKRDECDDMIVF